MILIERAYYKDCTLGRLTVNDFQCFTLELPWINNAKNISCIHEGEYKYTIRDSPSRGRQVVWLKDVYTRTDIQIHPGNFTRQIEGCILVGDSIKFLDSDTVPDVTNSVNTFNKLMSIIKSTSTVFIKGAAK